MNDYYKNCAFPKPRTKKKKRETVTDRTYYKVWTACDGTCQICGAKQGLQLHHIRYRSERKDLINNYLNCIMLCVKCHTMVHGNKKYWQPILLRVAKKLYKKED